MPLAQNEGSGITAADASGNSNTGVLGGDTDIPFDIETFTGADGSAPNSAYWTVFGSGTADIQTNALYVAGTTTSSTGVYGLTLVGDFDIQVDFSNFAISSGGGALTLRVNSGTYVVGIERRGGTWGNSILSEESYGTYSGNSFASTVTSGALRIARSGSTFTTYYNIGAGWVQLGSYAADTSNMYVQLFSRSGEGAGNPTGKFDNFKPTTSPIWTASGKISNALSFDGSNDYVDIGDMSATEGGALTVAFDEGGRLSRIGRGWYVFEDGLDHRLISGDNLDRITCNIINGSSIVEAD